MQYLAGSEDLEHERQAMRDELLGVLLFLDAAELFQKTLDQRSAVLMETCAQGLQPCVQSPRDPWETVTGVNTHECRHNMHKAGTNVACTVRYCTLCLQMFT